MVLDKTRNSFGLARAAESYAAMGWRIIPLEPRGKRPHKLLAPDGYKNATRDRATVAHWWRTDAEANIGFVPSSVHLCVIDIDEGGDRTAEALGLLAEPTLTVRTGKGEHRYYVHPYPGGRRIGNVDLGKGIDFRADAGYVVVPPSIHPLGNRYTWREEWSSPAYLPAQVLDRINETLVGPVSRKPLTASTARRTVRPVGPGTVILQGSRNNRLFRHGCRLRRRGADETAIFAELCSINSAQCRPPLQEGELATIARSAVRCDVTPNRQRQRRRSPDRVFTI